MDAARGRILFDAHRELPGHEGRLPLASAQLIARRSHGTRLVSSLGVATRVAPGVGRGRLVCRPPCYLLTAYKLDTVPDSG